jgi:hypothetical protein
MGPTAEPDLRLLEIGAEIVAVNAEEADAARRAWRRRGKRRHAAALNAIMQLPAIFMLADEPSSALDARWLWKLIQQVEDRGRPRRA